MSTVIRIKCLQRVLQLLLLGGETKDLASTHLRPWQLDFQNEDFKQIF